MRASAVKSGSVSSMRMRCPSNVSMASRRSSVVAGLSLRSVSVIDALAFCVDRDICHNGRAGRALTGVAVFLCGCNAMQTTIREQAHG